MSLLLRVAPGSIPGGLIIFCWCLILHGGMALFGCLGGRALRRGMLHGAVWVGTSLQAAFNVCFFGARVWSLDALQPVLPFDFFGARDGALLLPLGVWPTLRAPPWSI